MTLHTKEAMEEIYGIFNQPLKTPGVNENEAGSEESEDEDDYTSAGESTTTGQMSGATSEYEDETEAELTEAKSTIDDADDTTHTDADSVSAWSDFTISKHVPKTLMTTRPRISPTKAADTFLMDAVASSPAPNQSLAHISTIPTQTRIPALSASRVPMAMIVDGLFPLKLLSAPMPMAMPAGVTSA